MNTSNESPINKPNYVEIFGFTQIKQPPNSKLCGAACTMMASGIDKWDDLYAALNQFCGLDLSLESELKVDIPHFANVMDVVHFLINRGIMMGTYMTTDWENGQRIDWDNDDYKLIPIHRDRPALVGVDSETYPDKMHWVLWNGEQFQDPNPNKPMLRPLSDFEGKIVDWYPLCQITSCG